MALADKQSDKKSTARTALLLAAERLFTEKGYSAVSTREIADAAGVNLGAIQYHFGSKAKLFIETLHHLMAQGNSRYASDCLESACLQHGASDAKRALLGIGRYIRDVLDYMLRPSGPQVCRLMFREILSETSKDEELFEPLVDSIVESFIRPSDLKLRSALAIVAPQLSEQELSFTAKSVIGQCAFYISHQPFIERLEGRSFAASPHFEAAVAHIFQFTARALGISDSLIEATLPKIFETPTH